MKAFLVLAAFFSAICSASTTIYYDDGTTYTLLNGEDVFVSYDKKMFSKQEYLDNGQILFSPRYPNRKRDYVETVDPSDGLTPGGAEWCAVYEPFQDGYSFSDAIWSKNCTKGG